MTILGFLGGTPEGTRNIMVSASSSRENLRRAFAFYGSSPRYKNNPNPSPTEIRFGLLTLGTPEGTRTPDLLIRSQSLYPTELPAHILGDCNIIAHPL